MTSRSVAVDALRLRDLPGVGRKRYRALVDTFGGASEALAAPGVRFAQLAGKEAAAVRQDESRSATAERVVRQCASAAIDVVPYGSAAYPARLGDLSDPPAVIFTRGERSLLDGPCVAVVGSRRATAYGRRVARDVGHTLSRAGVCVVSGMALGIDGEAHEGALPGPTAAVLGSGVDVPSPRSQGSLYRRIVASGVVCSEFDPGVVPAPHHFPDRNRIIAALATEVIVVEAALNSGALITVNQALELGRDVYAVPGPVDRASAQGTNRLIADGAGVIVDPRRVGPYSRAEPKRPTDERERAVLCFLEAAPASLDEIADGTGLPPGAAATVVLSLEIGAWIVRTRDGRFAPMPGGRRVREVRSAHYGRGHVDAAPARARGCSPLIPGRAA